eukprot:1897814-Alexandrium_andersonii.AAC.1
MGALWALGGRLVAAWWPPGWRLLSARTWLAFFWLAHPACHSCVATLGLHIQFLRLQHLACIFSLPPLACNT